jgi:hypothetical protein
MNNEDITGVSANPWSWEVIPSDKSTYNNTDIQQQVYELVSKNYTLEYKNKELTTEVNNLETTVLNLMYRIEDLEQIVIKICDEYILNDDD